MNRDPGVCRWDQPVQLLDKDGGREVFGREGPEHREEERHEKSGGAPFSGDITQYDEELPVGERENVVQVTPDGIGWPRLARRLDAGGPICHLGQHRELNISRHLQVVLEREPVGHLEEDQEVDEHKAAQQPQRAISPHGARDGGSG